MYLRKPNVRWHFSPTHSWQATRSGTASGGQHNITHRTLHKRWHFPHLQRLNRGRLRQNPVTLPRAVIVEVSPVSSVTQRRCFKNNSTPVQHGDYMGRLSAKESGSRPDLMLWKFQPLYLRSTDLVSERGREWAMEALQRRGRMPGLFNRTAENDWLNPTPFPMKPLAKSKRQHVSHSTPNTNALCEEWRGDIRLTEPDCQVTDNQNMLSSLCHFGIFTVHTGSEDINELVCVCLHCKKSI